MKQKPFSFRFGVVCAAVCSLALAGSAGVASAAKPPILKAASYPGMTTYSCSTDPILMHPGQNLNLFRGETTCPNARVVRGPGKASVFNGPSQGYLTRFKPNMVVIRGKKLVTPPVDDLHLHHVVWLGPTNERFAAGEEKSYVKLPKGYGYRLTANAGWYLNYMIHDLRIIPNRRIRIQWEIDWVPAQSAAASGIKDLEGRWLDVAGLPQQVYPVFDAEKGFANTEDGKFTFPDDVPATPGTPGYEEREKISSGKCWTISQNDGVTLIFGAGHLHPGGEQVDLFATRGGDRKRIFTSTAKYYEPAGAISWDVAMRATRPDWRVELKKNDQLCLNATYDVSKASWYESMGILPLAYIPGRNESGSADPWDESAAFEAMRAKGGILTHGRLKENIDARANRSLGLANPADLPDGSAVPAEGVVIENTVASPGGFSAIKGFPASQMRPPTVPVGSSVTFTSEDALLGSPVTQQIWHTITSCRNPCNRGPGIGYPLAGGPVKFDSGQLGFTSNSDYGNGEVVEQTNTFTTPTFSQPGTYTWFCRIHPLMRGSIRVK